MALCNSPEIYNYEIESDQDSEIIESKLQINTYINDEKVEVNFQLFPKNIEKIQSYELLSNASSPQVYGPNAPQINPNPSQKWPWGSLDGSIRSLPYYG